ncbi:MAG: long-chain fatty acid transporter, partial [Sulfurovum sp.]|nr:long-chain fatty acid transporter [Sulfurovum sp.]
KSGANVAYTIGADSNYDNPANMSFLDESKSYVEGGITLVTLPSNKYTLIDPYSGKSETENLPIPFFHYVSDAIGDFRWGVSMVVPGGLTKRWESQPQKSFVEEFTLKVIEVSPNIAYKVSDDFSIAGGVRLLYSEGIVKSTGQVSRDMEGSTFAFGYNLAMTYKPTSDINLAVTYRSNVDLDEEGSAKLYAGPNLVYSGDASVSVPLPASLNLAISKTWQEKFTLEFNYERAFWSQYETLDFEYGGANLGGLTPYFDTPIPKNWKDTNTFRLGATIKMDNKITAMMGFAIDESPVPLNTLGFETPDTDARIFSMGFAYQQTENLSWGLAFLYDSKEGVSLAPGETITNNPVLANGGSFSGGGAYLTTVGVAYEF